MGIAVNIGWVFLVTWLPRFLIARHGSELATYVSSTETLAGVLTAAVGLGGMLGSFAGGAAADRFVKLYGLKWGRRLPGLTAGIVAGVLYLVAMQLTSVWPLVALMIAISFTIDYGLGAIWASYQDIGGRHVATVLGIGNMFGNWGAAGFGYYIGVLAKSDRWPTVFLIASLAMLLYASGWLLFDARRPVVREPS
jgi:ACS family glucarate transporter-like MFS transporter